VNVVAFMWFGAYLLIWGTILRFIELSTRGSATSQALGVIY
jgi:hypothetical protein